MPFDATFPLMLGDVTAQNPALYDGAVMVRRQLASEVYRIVGWSFRLFPQFSIAEAPENRGSAFNSCLSMSNLPEVDAIYLLSRAGVFRFERGKAMALKDAPP